MSDLPDENDLAAIVSIVRAATEALVLLGDAVQAAIAALDRFDGDPDLEEGGDAEHSLGAPNPTFPSLTANPAIGVLSNNLSQIRWSAGARDEDREAEHDGREVDSTPTDQG